MYSWLIQMLKQNILDTVADRTNVGGRRGARLLVEDDGVLVAGFCDDAPASDVAARSRRDPAVGGGSGSRGGEGGAVGAVGGSPSAGSPGAAAAGCGMSARVDGVQARTRVDSTALAGVR